MFISCAEKNGSGGVVSSDVRITLAVQGLPSGLRKEAGAVNLRACVPDPSLSYT